jgi:hypothetical protein
MPCHAIHALHYPGAAEPKKKKKKKANKKGNKYSFALSLYKFIGIGIGIQQSSLFRKRKKKKNLCYTKPQNDNHDHKKQKYGIRYVNKHTDPACFHCTPRVPMRGGPAMLANTPLQRASQASPSVL